MIAKGGQPDIGGRPSSLRTIEGLAIISADGMIADASGAQPEGLLLEADKHFFHARLDAADVLVHGRYSGEGGPGAERRRRIMLTRRIAGVMRDPDNPRAVLWNPAGATLADAWSLAAPAGGLMAVIGGTEVFGLFLDVGYDVFHLSRANRTSLPGGRPVFPTVPQEMPEAVLTRYGLKPDATCILDASANLTLTTWRR